MNRSAIVFVVSLFFSLGAHAAESTTLCSPPLATGCVQPNWGQVEPDGTGDDASGSAGPATPSTASRAGMPSATARIGAELMPVQMASRARSLQRPSQIKAQIDGNARFRAETKELTTAITLARFDRSGRIVRGEDRIATAAEAARRAASNFDLTLYIKAPTKLAGAARTLLNAKLASLNAVLGNAPSQPRT